jgi:hypothetical protein
MLHRRPHGLDALALHQNLAGLEHISGINLKQPRRMQHDRRAHWLLRDGRDHKTSGKPRARTTQAQSIATGTKKISWVLHD